MVVGEDAKLSAYFFTSFTEADRILKLANQSVSASLTELKKEVNEKRKLKGEKPLTTRAEVEDEVGINPWSEARVSSVPLDFAVALASKGKLKGAYFRIAPSEEDVQDALEVDTSVDDLAEGKVPLFYLDDWEVDGKNPLYFQKAQLIKEWKKRSFKGEVMPIVKVTELFVLLASMVESTAGEEDDDLEKLVFVAPGDSVAKAKACAKKGGSEIPFKLGERIVVL